MVSTVASQLASWSMSVSSLHVLRVAVWVSSQTPKRFGKLETLLAVGVTASVKVVVYTECVRPVIEW